MLHFEGTILTVDKDDAVARHLVVEGARIVFVGDRLPEKYASFPTILLGERVLVPSFVDTHQHLASFATFHDGLNVMEAASNEEILSLLSDFSKRSSNKILIGFGTSPHSVKEKRLITREELDRVVPDRPVMIVKYDGHAAVINSKLMAQLEKKLSPKRGYNPESGEMNQEAFFAVTNHISSSISLTQLVGCIQKAIDYQAERGIGMIHTVSGVGFPLNVDISLEKWISRSLENGFQVRVFPQSLNIRTALRRRLPRIGGCFATALDGCFGSLDAALNAPYCGAEHSGVLFYDDATVTDFCKKANRAGLQIELHAIGDRAFDQATRALRAALEDFPREDHRHGIIHACFPTPEGLSICADYGIQLPMQSAFIQWKQEPDEYFEAILGARAEKLNPLRTIWDKGIVISGGSDAPCTDPDPIEWIHKACNHSVRSESLTPQEALRMCTYNATWTTFDEKARGSLEAGKIADMVVLSGDPYTITPSKLNTLKVETLYLSGKEYGGQQQSTGKALLKGMFGGGKNY